MPDQRRMAGLRDRREAGVEAARDLAAAGVEALEPLELLEADRRIELGRPHVEAGGDEQKRGSISGWPAAISAPCSRSRTHPCARSAAAKVRQSCVVRHHHPALDRRDVVRK